MFVKYQKIPDRNGLFEGINHFPVGNLFTPLTTSLLALYVRGWNLRHLG